MLTSVLKRSLLTALVVVLGCSAEAAVGPPPEAPELRQGASEILPEDLDVAVRFDLSRMRLALGPESVSRLAAQADAGDRPLVAEVLKRADVVWLGFRPGLPVELTDNVLVAEGDFDDVKPGRAEWGIAEDLGGGWLRYTRQTQEITRAAPARLYLRLPDLAVLVSEAELDAVERSLERREEGRRVAPPGSGLMAIGARGRALREALEPYPMVQGLLRGVAKLVAEVDLTGPLLRFEVELHVSASADAEDLASDLRRTLQGLEAGSDMAAFVAGRIEVEAVGTVTMLRLELPEALMTGILGCGLGLRAPEDCR